jgi:hypothetical protein
MSYQTQNNHSYGFSHFVALLKPNLKCLTNQPLHTSFFMAVNYNCRKFMTYAPRNVVLKHPTKSFTLKTYIGGMININAYIKNGCNEFIIAGVIWGKPFSHCWCCPLSFIYFKLTEGDTLKL